MCPFIQSRLLVHEVFSANPGLVLGNIYIMSEPFQGGDVTPVGRASSFESYARKRSARMPKAVATLGRPPELLQASYGLKLASEPTATAAVRRQLSNQSEQIKVCLLLVLLSRRLVRLSLS